MADIYITKKSFVTSQSPSVPVPDEAPRPDGIEGSEGLIPQLLNLGSASHEVDRFTLRPFFPVAVDCFHV